MKFSPVAQGDWNLDNYGIQLSVYFCFIEDPPSQKKKLREIIAIYLDTNVKTVNGSWDDTKHIFVEKLIKE